MHPVRGFCQLAQEMAGGFKGAVDIPKGAGPAKPGELQPCGRVAFGDRARLIDPDKEERNALGAGALQGREPVRHLFNRRPEPVAEPFQIVAIVLRGG